MLLVGLVQIGRQPYDQLLVQDVVAFQWHIPEYSDLYKGQ